MKSAPLRWLGALGLAVSFVLPQTSCQGYYSPEGEFVRTIPSVADSSEYTPGVDWGYVVEEMTTDDPASWAWPIVFVWPLALLLVLTRRPARQPPSWRVWLELPAIVATGFALFTFIVLATQAWGNLVAFGFLGCYAAGWCLDVRGWYLGRSDGTSLQADNGPAVEVRPGNDGNNRGDA